LPAILAGPCRAAPEVAIDRASATRDNPPGWNSTGNDLNIRLLAHRALSAVLIASVAHLPVPVIDGDDRAPADSASPLCAAGGARSLDVDLVLLGCNAPDDPDDGPVDDDFDEGQMSSSGIGPAFRATKGPFQPRRDIAAAAEFCGQRHNDCGVPMVSNQTSVSDAASIAAGLTRTAVLRL
jgi:hypothetical protein